MTAPVVSVVTPFYNTADHLAECIESVLRQTWGRFEYVLVNNCSTDGSREIAASYAARDTRIRLIDQPVFLDQTANYNSALQAISPESRYCKMVQADDWIFPRCLEEMVGVAERDRAIGVVGSMHFFGDQLQFTGMPPEVAVYEGKDICRRQLLAHHYFMGNPTTLLFSAGCVRERVPFFVPGRFADDLEACFDILRDHRFGYVAQVLSYVRVRGESIMGVRSHQDPIAASYYVTVRKYGPVYLGADERRPLERAVARNYWMKLGLAAWLLRERGYWEFQRARLAEVGERIRWRNVAAGAARVALHAVLHPRWTAATVRNELARRAGRPTRRPMVWGLG